ncbi:ADP-ribosylglycohydrolase [Microbacterium resistens]|uniref:ADP-ribosylglycohydrolase n=1 Tax=Microbacterium resistens TaxID=156977 RepID=A0ABU1SEU5_9MICO|nr:ADP-ribosylglycohydrolase family protein [Microbacterium resistens]MDR6868123.1 ADP-ribosylglycohydrolase [Microbacterium resistens]
MRLTWAQPEDLVPHELRQAESEGKDVAAVAAVAERWRAAGGQSSPPRGGASPEPAPSAVRALARELLAELDRIPALDPEPTVWTEVRALLPDLPPRMTAHAGAADLPDRLLGAWTGRSAGCLLGKPVEKIPREGIEEILRATGRWPLTGYFTARGLPDDVAARWPWNRRSAVNSLEENISGMPEDDDLNYPLLNLRLLETAGRGFRTDDVAEAWLLDLPAGRTFTAERIAYRNLLDGYSPDEAARIGNPFREWIGALIRTDVYGWVNPGDLGEAARMAWTDARLSHTRDGVWGAMWAAALTSASLVADSVDEVLDLAAAAVPAESRLARAIAIGAEIGRGSDDDATALDRLYAAYGDLHWVHTINNAALIAFALARSGGDFATGVPLAVLAGWDTDSAAATVGSVLGGLTGASRLPAGYVEPLRNRIATSLPGLDGVAIDDLARRTAALIP